MVSIIINTNYSIEHYLFNINHSFAHTEVVPSIAMYL